MYFAWLVTHDVCTQYRPMLRAWASSLCVLFPSVHYWGQVHSKMLPKNELHTYNGTISRLAKISTMGLLDWSIFKNQTTEAYLKSSLNFIPSVFFSSLFLCMICNHAKMYMFNVNEVQHVLFWYSVIEVILIIIYLLDIILLWAAFSKNIKAPLS